MIHKIVPATVWALIVSEATLVFTAYVAVAYVLIQIDPLLWLIWEDGLLRILTLVAWILIGLYFQDLYSKFRIRSRFVLLQQVSLVLGTSFLFQALVSYGLPKLLLPRGVMLAGSLAVVMLVPLWRYAYGHLVAQALSTERLLFLGASPLSQDIAHRLDERSELGNTVVGFLAEQAELESLPIHWRLGSPADLAETVARIKPDKVVVGFVERRQRMPVQELLAISFTGVPVEEAATTYELVLQRVSTMQLRPSQLIFSRELGPKPSKLKVQAAYSRTLAALGLLVVGPIMLIVAVLVRLTSPGPALYSQRRVGLHGELFTLYKFRSMGQDAEAVTGAVWASRGDPRITAFGRFLRASRLDELPQLFNVLKGEMSIVGPRPEL